MNIIGTVSHGKALAILNAFTASNSRRDVPESLGKRIVFAWWVQCMVFNHNTHAI
jgi:hypothetical protein